MLVQLVQLVDSQVLVLVLCFLARDAVPSPKLSAPVFWAASEEEQIFCVVRSCCNSCRCRCN